jgi:hypothetical protein
MLLVTKKEESMSNQAPKAPSTNRKSSLIERIAAPQLVADYAHLERELRNLTAELASRNAQGAPAKVKGHRTTAAIPFFAVVFLVVLIFAGLIIVASYIGGDAVLPGLAALALALGATMQCALAVHDQYRNPESIGWWRTTAVAGGWMLVLVGSVAAFIAALRLFS